MSVGELYNSSTHKVNPDNFNILMKYISGNDVVDISKVRALANSQTSAKDIRSNIVSAGTQGDTSYVAKANGKDICVRLGGLDWQVMYLSTDKSGNSILTLWLDNNVQDAWMNRSSPETGDYAFINGGLYSRYSVWTSQDQWEYPSNMYGTSYVSAVTLNNGGLYSIYADNKVAEAEQDSGSVFALFTMSQFGLTDHLITPRQVGWQENQSALEILTSSTTKYSNDAWSKTTSSQGFIFPVVNFASKEYSDQWADAYLWLPSMCETGYNSSNVGLWETSTEQRSNFDGITTSVTGSVGSDTTIRIRSRTMLRSGHTDATTLEYATSTIKSLQPTGTACHGDNVKVVAYAVRPALHINLNSMYLDVMEQTARGVEVGQIYNTTTKALDTNNVKILTKYITGNAGATSSTVSTNATEITDASEIRGYTISAGTEGGVAYYAKAAGQDVTVTIGGIEWTAMYLSKDKNNNSVLTLWMNGFKQNSWSTRSSTEGAYYGFSDGIMYSDYSANWSSPSQGNYPSNMYGTSYINAVTLNNGGSYATSNSAVTTATQSSSSVFAPYTMSSYGLTQYLVKPRNVAWQENQSAKDIEHVSFNYPNDAWSTSTSDNGFFSTPNGVSNYASKTSSDKWADSYLWLPSATEVGYADNALGIWKSSQAQRGNYGAIEDEVVGSNTGVTFASSWLRSGHFMDDPSFAYSTNYSGTDMLVNVVSDSRVVRPCIHLNLTAMMQAVGIASVSEVDVQQSGVRVAESNNLVDNIDSMPVISRREEVLGIGLLNCQCVIRGKQY